MSPSSNQAGSRPAVRIDAAAAMASFRSPAIADVHLPLPCPPPSTVRGMLAAALGSYENLPDPLVVAYRYAHAGAGVDLEKRERPLAGRTTPSWEDKDVTEVAFHANPQLTVWLLDADPDRLAARLRRPTWPVSLGRSQDLCRRWQIRITGLGRPGSGARQGQAVVPAAPHPDGGGQLLDVTAVVSKDRGRTAWTRMRYAPEGDDVLLHGQTVLADPLDGNGSGPPSAVVPFQFPDVP